MILQLLGLIMQCFMLHQRYFCRRGWNFANTAGVIAAIHQRFIKTGRMEKEFGKNINWLFELRSIGDYGVTAHVPAADAEQAISTAMSFIQKVRSILSY